MKAKIIIFIKTLLFFLSKLIFLPLKILFPSKLKIEKIPIKFSHLPKNLRGVKFIQLSDFHWDYNEWRISSKFMEEVIEITNNLQPDFILLTGDYIQYDPSNFFKIIYCLLK